MEALTQENEQLKKQLEELTKKTEGLQSQLNTCQAEGGEKGKEATALQKELDETKAELEQAKKDLVNSQVSDQAKAEQVKTLSAKVSELENKVQAPTIGKSLTEKLAHLISSEKGDQTNAEENATKEATKETPKAADKVEGKDKSLDQSQEGKGKSLPKTGLTSMGAVIGGLGTLISSIGGFFFYKNKKKG